MLLSQDELLPTLFHNIDAEPVQRSLELPTGKQELAVALADTVWALGSTGKFVWPIPDKGLEKRLHRITAPTLSSGASTTGSSRRSTRRSSLPASRTRGWRSCRDAGHVPQVEQLDVVAPLVLDFLAA